MNRGKAREGAQYVPLSSVEIGEEFHVGWGHLKNHTFKVVEQQGVYTACVQIHIVGHAPVITIKSSSLVLKDKDIIWT